MDKINKNKTRKAIWFEYIHFNLGLTAVNIAKMTHWTPLKKKKKITVFYARHKSYYCNDLHIDIFIKEVLFLLNNLQLRIVL